jgi:ribosomal protein S18 acetylase RimI-like enzyme
MFELSDKFVEDIIFAMEDQEHALLVDVETGDIVPRDSDGSETEEGDDPASGETTGERRVDPPEWTSRDGFKLMEDFLAFVRQPSVRHELQGALSRGKGVFKTFKAVLSQHEDIERAFRDYKAKAMRRVVAEWYDDRREARGLARIGPEPEDTRDLLASDFQVRVVPLAEARDELIGLVREAGEQAMPSLAAPLAVYEATRLVEEIERCAEGLCARVDDGEGGTIGAAAAFIALTGDRGIGRIVFIGVREGYRRMGLGTALLEALAERLVGKGIDLVVLDSAFVPPEYCGKLAALGYEPYGTRAVARRQ